MSAANQGLVFATFPYSGSRSNPNLSKSKLAHKIFSIKKDYMSAANQGLVFATNPHSGSRSTLYYFFKNYILVIL